MANTKENPNTAISRPQAREAIDAATFAWRQDIPLTYALHFQLDRLPEKIRPQEFISHYLKLVSDWLLFHREARAHVWVLEKPFGKSENAHILLHLPERLRKKFRDMQSGWMKQAGLERYPAGWDKKNKVLEYQKIGISKGRRNRIIGGGRLDMSEGMYLAHLERMLGYMLKGTDPNTAALLRIDHVPQGTIEGKRLGISQSISKAARERAGYRAPSSVRQSLLFNWRYEIENPAVPE